MKLKAIDNMFPTSEKPFVTSALLQMQEQSSESKQAAAAKQD